MGCAFREPRSAAALASLRELPQLALELRRVCLMEGGNFVRLRLREGVCWLNIGRHCVMSYLGWNVLC